MSINNNLLENLLDNHQNIGDDFFEDNENLIKLNTSSQTIEVKETTTSTTYKDFSKAIEIILDDYNIEDSIIEIVDDVDKIDSPLKKVSYSQYSKFRSCPLDWYLSYIKGIRTFKDNIHNILGTSIHVCLQEYLTICYKKSGKEGDKYNFYIKLKEVLINEIKKAKKKPENTGNKFINIEELTEAYNDGVEILEFIRKHRGDYFSLVDYDLVGVEVPLDININDEKIKFVGFIDLVFKHKKTAQILVKDIKCTYGGWSAEKKKDPIKKNQLLLYKKFYADNYKAKIEDIEVEFFIVRRKIWQSDWGEIKRVQLFKPAQSIYTVNDVMKDFNKFITSCFDLETGQYKDDVSLYTPTPSPTSCEYCSFKNNKELCKVGLDLPKKVYVKK